MVRHIEDFFEKESWLIAGEVVDTALNGAMQEAGINIETGNGQMVPLFDMGVREDISNYNPSAGHEIDEEILAVEDEPITEESEIVHDGEGIYWTDLGGLQAAIAYGIAQRIRMAYLMGRLDQIADNNGTNTEKYVRARDLGRVINMAEGLIIQSAESLDPKADRIYAKAWERNSRDIFGLLRNEQ